MQHILTYCGGLEREILDRTKNKGIIKIANKLELQTTEINKLSGQPILVLTYLVRLNEHQLGMVTVRKYNVGDQERFESIKYEGILPSTAAIEITDTPNITLEAREIPLFLTEGELLPPYLHTDKINNTQVNPLYRTDDHYPVLKLADYEINGRDHRRSMRERLNLRFPSLVTLR